jgi:hypothetical protein
MLLCHAASTPKNPLINTDKEPFSKSARNDRKLYAFYGTDPPKSKKNRRNPTEAAILEDQQGYWTTPASIKNPHRTDII